MKLLALRPDGLERCPKCLHRFCIGECKPLKHTFEQRLAFINDQHKDEHNQSKLCTYCNKPLWDGREDHEPCIDKYLKENE